MSHSEELIKQEDEEETSSEEEEELDDESVITGNSIEDDLSVNAPTPSTNSALLSDNITEDTSDTSSVRPTESEQNLEKLVLKREKAKQKRKELTDQTIKKVLRKAEMSSMESSKSSNQRKEEDCKRYKPYTEDDKPIVRYVSSSSGNYLVIPNDVSDVSAFLFTKRRKKE
ncbi:hypothetical protein ABK040_004653 [Willaertia magna]